MMQDENGFYHMKPQHNDDINASEGAVESEKKEDLGFSEENGNGGASVEYGPVGAYYTDTKKSSGGKGIVALVIVACLLFSAIAGVGGLLIGKNMYGNTPSGNGTGGGNSVLGGASESVTINTLSKDTVIADGSFASVAEACAGSVVEIQTAPITGSITGVSIDGAAGSGVIIGLGNTTKFPYLVTNNHVIEGYTSITVLSNTGEKYEAKVVGSDWMSDIAVLVIEDSTTGLEPAVCGDSAKMVLGQEVVAIGNPLGSLGGSLTEGVISSVSRQISIESIPMTLLQTSAAINPGNSGGGLFDMNGCLIGIVNAKITGSAIDGIGFAIPVNTALEKVEQIIEQGYVSGTPDLGFTFASNDSNTIYSYRYNDEIAVESKKIKANDILYSIGGKTIKDYSDYKAAMASLKNPDGSLKTSVEVVIRRMSGFNPFYATYDDFTVEIKVHEYIPSAQSGGENVEIETEN
ncbi:MAG: trypsin-like peptidase domain-containing protein [Clostridia bacterium]|nr:trypsin-like peptidase domain-containing protein [Clostridia bacterium]